MNNRGNYRDDNRIPDSVIIADISLSLGKSLVAIAKELNISKHTLYAIRNGRNNLSGNLIDKMMKKYPELNKDYILYGTGNITDYLIGKNDYSEEIYKEVLLLKQLVIKMQNEMNEMKRSYERFLKNL